MQEETIINRAIFDDLKSIQIPGEPSVIETLLKVFFEQGPNLHSQLIVAIHDGGDCDEIRRLAHKLSGTCSNFGGVQINKLCREMEDCAKRKSLAEARILAPVLTSAFEAFCEALRGEISPCPQRNAS